MRAKIATRETVNKARREAYQLDFVYILCQNGLINDNKNYYYYLLSWPMIQELRDTKYLISLYSSPPDTKSNAVSSLYKKNLEGYLLSYSEEINRPITPDTKIDWSGKSSSSCYSSSLLLWCIIQHLRKRSSSSFNYLIATFTPENIIRQPPTSKNIATKVIERSTKQRGNTIKPHNKLLISNFSRPISKRLIVDKKVWRWIKSKIILQRYRISTQKRRIRIN